MNARPVFTHSGRTAAGIAERLRGPRPVFLFLDYDGTIVPIRRRPSDASLARGTKQLLQALNETPRVRMGLVTGRSLGDIQKLAPLRWRFIAANHGLEILFRGRLWIHPGAKKAAPVLDAIATELKSSLLSIPNASVEHKGYTLAIHHRRVQPRLEPAVEAAVRRAAAPYAKQVLIRRGRKIWEVRPAIDWTKGSAVLRLLRSMDRRGKGIVVYMGDDATDEDAFMALPPDAVTVKVGGSMRTHARLHVRTVSEAKRILALIAAPLRE